MFRTKDNELKLNKRYLAACRFAKMGNKGMVKVFATPLLETLYYRPKHALWFTKFCKKHGIVFTIKIVERYI